MFKTKLSILFLISTIISLNGCTSKDLIQQNKYKLSYVSGEVDGLIFSNFLKSYLKSANLYDEKSNFDIRATISHSQNLFITNIDNTSDRQKIISTMTINVYDIKKKCDVFNYSDDLEQFYIITSSINYTSNNKAVEQIKSQNTEILINKLLPQLSRINPICSLDE